MTRRTSCGNSRRSSRDDPIHSTGFRVLIRGCTIAVQLYLGKKHVAADYANANPPYGLFDVPGVRLADLSPDLLTASSFLPGTPPRDPADRILAATARDLGATLITRDRALLAYGADGYIGVVAC
jgi:hypothetical protein